MGGSAAGEVASKIAVETFTSELTRSPLGIISVESVASSVRIAHDRVVAAADQTPAYLGMGTTLVALIVDIDRGRALIAHAGDSRIHLIRSGRLELLTRDHNIGEELIAAGAFGRAEISRVRHANAITRALGIEPFPGAEISERKIFAGDLFLLCSDGLTNVLSEEEILRAVDPAAIENSADRLIRRARDGGAPDNVTAILALAETDSSTHG